MVRVVEGEVFHVYCLVEEGCRLTGPCKVGVATRMGTRLSSLQGGNWRQLEIAWLSSMKDRDNALDVEARILARLRPSIYGHPGRRRRLKSEWVDATPAEAYEAGRDLLALFLEEEVA
jgi:hypothetical protein